MLPAESRLEVVSLQPARASRKPPLLFIHGGYCDAWCWTPYFLPWFAARGWPAYAMSLRGHGQSGGYESLFVAGLDDFVADVEHVSGQLSAPPILIGHSMGAAIVERMLATRPVRGAALLAPVPPAGSSRRGRAPGRDASRLVPHLAQFDPSQLSDGLLATLRPFYFGPEVPVEILREAERHMSIESPRALLDLSLRLHMALPQRPCIADHGAGRERRPHLHARRRARDRAASRRDGDDAAGHGAHDDAGARMGNGGGRRWPNGSDEIQ